VILENGDDCEDLIHAGIVKRSRTTIIHGAGVNVSQFRPSPEPDGVPVVLLPSRMLWDKGVGEFVQAARILKESRVRAKCVLVGMVDKESPSAIREDQLRRWEEEGVVEWHGHREDMSNVFASSHVVVLPSYAEGLPMVLLEGAASARPLIATRVRGCRDIVRNGENGLLVPPKDSHALARAIMTLLHDKALREKMGARGRVIVMNEFTAERIAGETIAVYRRLLGNDRAISQPVQQGQAIRSASLCD
jgi:glycosyltransferase involved in cell wall biosynthesis